MGIDTFNSRGNLTSGGRNFILHRLSALTQAGIGHVERLPFSLKILLENLLRLEDGRGVTDGDIRALAEWTPGGTEREISYTPARVLLQDFTGVPVVVDLATMRDAIVELGGDPARINPAQPVDLVIDHSVQVDHFGAPGAFARNVELEFERNRERYQFLRWGQQAFQNFRVVPPGTGIVHQVNLEYLATVVFTGEDGSAYPDTLVGTDSHTTMINGLGVLGWGVGGIEAEAAMLGQPVAMLIPDVVGFRLTGRLPEGATGTDLVLQVVQMLREKGVVGKFVEFFGEGLSSLPLAARATIANMAPEYGATMGFFPVDDETLAYLRLSGRDEFQVQLVEEYCREQGLFRTDGEADLLFSDRLELDLGDIGPSIAGPRRPQDRIGLRDAKSAWRETLPTLLSADGRPDAEATLTLDGSEYRLANGSVVIAAITSCTNTSNPELMLGAGLLAKKAVEKGLSRKPWVKTSLAPGSQVVSEYLRASGLSPFLDELGFDLVGYGCTTCIGNSGPLPEPVSSAIRDGDLAAVAVLSGNRNFEGRVNPDARANYLVSPPLVVAYALAGTMDIDLHNEPLGEDIDGSPVYLGDIWPSTSEVVQVVQSSVHSGMFRECYSAVFEGEERWRELPTPDGTGYMWDDASTYIRKPPFFEGISPQPEPVRDVENARAIVVVGDSTTTDHSSPAGNIAPTSPAADYLRGMDVARADFNQ
ncbi:MAG TPA: aconitate hydratase AcnA, partial [Dehalococcoidia bacterium]|nr:aconitate hydratase AcnA [Dehalococcoidia bacterium]